MKRMNNREKDLHLILHKNIQECPILDKNIQYTLSKKCIKKEDSVLPRKKFFFKGMNFFFKKTSR